jgi:hypothetical protein
MADNSSLPVASGNETFANNDIGGVKYPRQKMTWGPAGTANDTDVASGKPVPAQIRSATGLIPIGEPTDAAATATDTTSVTAISLWKQISKTLQAAASSAAGLLFVRLTDGTNSSTIKATSTAPVTATDTALVTVLRPDSAGIIATGTQASPSASYLSTVAAGDIAAAASDSGNPVKIGAKATNAEPTALTTGQRANLIADLVGKLIVLPYANPENFVSGAITTAMTGTTTTSLIAAPAAGLRNYITQITVSNAHATVGTDVIIQDGSGGAALYTIPAAAVYGGAVITFPTPLRQPSTATAIFCANVTTGASTKVSASGYKGA